MQLIGQADLRERLLRSEITWEEAADRIATHNRGRIHRSEEWKALRAKLIKEHCEQCGTSEAPFTLHHLVQPPTLGDISHTLFKTRYERYKSEHPIEIADDELPKPDRQACPKCGFRTIYWRKKTADWKCNRQSAVCGHVFKEPAVAKVVETSVRSEAYERRYANWLVLKQELHDAVMREAVLIWIEVFERYMSGTDTATFCKRCAYMWDQKGLWLCPKCKEGYTPMGAQECPACSSSHKMCASCGRRRHHVRYTACYECNTVSVDPG